MEKVAKIQDISHTVKRARKQRGLTQQDLADICGVGRRFISDLEGGKKTRLDLGLTLRVLQRLNLKLQIG